MHSTMHSKQSLPLLPVGRHGRQHQTVAVGALVIFALATLALVLIESGGRPAVFLSKLTRTTTMLEHVKCTTLLCEMERACGAHTGDEEACFSMEPFCKTCGERNPCYYVDGTCRLRKGYGPHDKEGTSDSEDGSDAGEEGDEGDENPVLSIFEKDAVKEG